MGTITNLLANDLGVIEIRLTSFLVSVASPILLVGMTILLVTRIGWVAIVGIAVLLLLIPLSFLISKKNG